jgi:hypothetical protein
MLKLSLFKYFLAFWIEDKGYGCKKYTLSLARVFLRMRNIRQSQITSIWLILINPYLFTYHHNCSCIEESAQEKYFWPFLLLQYLSENNNCEVRSSQGPGTLPSYIEIILDSLHEPT